MSVILDFTKRRPLRDEREYEAALGRIHELLRKDPEPFSEEDDELHFLSLLVEDYEERQHPIEFASPQEVVDFVLEQRAMTRVDLYDVMGGKSRVSEFFAGKRALSLSQIVALRDHLGIPADALVPLSGQQP